MPDGVLALLLHGVQAGSGHLHARHLIHCHFQVQLFSSVSQPILNSWLFISIWHLDFLQKTLAVSLAHIVLENIIENPYFMLQP